MRAWRSARALVRAAARRPAARRAFSSVDRDVAAAQTVAAGSASELGEWLSSHGASVNFGSLVGDAMRAYQERVPWILEWYCTHRSVSGLGALLESVVSGGPSEATLDALKRLVLDRRAPLNRAQSHGLVSTVLSRRGAPAAKALLLSLVARNLAVYSPSFLLLLNAFITRSDWRSVEEILDVQARGAVALTPDEYRQLFGALEREDTPGPILLRLMLQCHSFGVFLEPSVYQRCVASSIESASDPSVVLSMVREMEANHFDAPLPLQFQLLQFYARLGRHQIPVPAAASSLAPLQRETIAKHALLNGNFLYVEETFLRASGGADGRVPASAVQDLVATTIDQEIVLSPTLLRRLSCLRLDGALSGSLLASFQDPRHLELSQRCLEWIGDVDLAQTNKYCHFLKRARRYDRVGPFLERCAALNAELPRDAGFQVLRAFYDRLREGSDLSAFLSSDSEGPPTATGGTRFSSEEYRVLFECAADRSEWSLLLRLHGELPEGSAPRRTFASWACLASIHQGNAAGRDRSAEEMASCSAAAFERLARAAAKAGLPAVFLLRVLGRIKQSIPQREIPLFLASVLESYPMQFQALFRDVQRGEQPIVEPLASALLKAQPDAPQRQALYESLQRNPHFRPGAETLHLLLHDRPDVGLLREWRAAGRLCSSESYAILLRGCAAAGRAEGAVRELLQDPAALTPALLVQCLQSLQGHPQMREFAELLLRK